MDLALIRRLGTGIAPILALFCLLLASLYLMGRATQHSEEFEGLYSVLLVVNVLELVLLLYLISINMLRLYRQYRAGATGSRLTVRLVVVFVLLAVVPVSLVYYFSLDFLRRGIDSWFDVRMDQAMENSMTLSRTVLEGRMRDLLRQTESLADRLSRVAPEEAGDTLRLLTQPGMGELTLLTGSGQVLSTSGIDTIFPVVPDDGILLQLRQGITYVGLDEIRGAGLNIRVVAPLSGPGGRILQALYPVPDQVAALAKAVQSSYARYKQLAFLRDPLKFSFMLTLSLVLLLSLLTAVWVAFYAARRLVSPIRTLAIGTRAVAAGDYDRRLPLPSHDEFGVLVESFNDMTAKLAQARDEARHSQREIESQRAYLEAVLARLSSGVLTVDEDQVLRIVNQAASQILGIPLVEMLGHKLPDLARGRPQLHHFLDTIADHMCASAGEWRGEITVFSAAGRQVLSCGGAALPGVAGKGGYVILIEDITAQVQAQRDAAWGEVARRLAHEIKNPLTPIRLSAERLRHKCLPHLAPREADVLDRATHTIVQQVVAMQGMVKAFSDYAYTPKLERVSLNLNEVITEVVELYRAHRADIQVDLAPALPDIEGDAGRFRQLLHNLIKNALEAVREQKAPRVRLITRTERDVQDPMVTVQVMDNGPGFPPGLLGRVFDPYVTTKPKGSGLGLAIVKKIVEEHGGMITAENAGPGACVTIRLPVAVEDDAGPRKAVNLEAS
ncbi:MAG TPA: HAMP domain-containing protein [Gammaproteobacteria bacterium]|nr:HAMP domain-containing protein [Gammaproteobacteria bacterium]